MPDSLPITSPISPAITPGVARPPLLVALTSIRFFAALHVALYHLVRPFERWGVFTPMMSAGYSGVSFFFVLSGFILAYAHAAEYESGRGRPAKFWVARFARIYPVYLVSMIFAGLLGRDQFRNPVHIIAYVADLALLQSWSMRMINFFNANAWTLSNEAFFYLVFPFVFLRLRPQNRARALMWCGVFFLLAILFPMICVLLFGPAAWSEFNTATVNDHGLIFLVDRLPLLALPEFLAGISIGWLYLRFRPTVRASSLMATGGLVLILGALFFSNKLPYAALHNGLLIPIYALLLLGLSADNWLSRLLSAKPLVLLGEASFAFYLIHANLYGVASRMGLFNSVGGLCVTLMVTLAIAVALHLLVERPGRRVILKWYARRHPAQMKVVA